MAILFDQFGREIQVEKRPETRQIAVTTIRDRWSNYPSQGLTPERLSAIFKEADGGDVARQAELFEEMEEKDTHLFSELQTRKNAVLGLDYDITPWSESAEDRKIRDFVADCLFSLEPLEESLLDLLDAVGKGYALSEILWGFDGSRAVLNAWGEFRKEAVFYNEVLILQPGASRFPGYSRKRSLFTGRLCLPSSSSIIDTRPAQDMIPARECCGFAPGCTSSRTMY